MSSMLTDSAPATAERAPMRARTAGSPVPVTAVTNRGVVLRGLSWSYRATESQARSVPNPAPEHRGICPGTEVSAQKRDAHHNNIIAADRDVD